MVEDSIILDLIKICMLVMELDIWIGYLDGGWLLSDTWSRFGNIVQIKSVHQLRQYYMEWDLLWKMKHQECY